MKRLSYVCLFAFLFAIPCNARNNAEIFDALSNNIKLTELKSANTAAIQQLKEENSLSGPEAEFEHLWSKTGERKWNFGISQNFEWPGIYSVRSQKIKHTLAINKYIEDAELLSLKLEAASLMTQLYFNRQKVQVLDKIIETLTEFAENLSTGVDHGLVTILDLKKAQIESTTLKIERDLLIDNKLTLISELQQLVGENFNLDNFQWDTLPLFTSLKTLDSYLTDADSDPSILASEAMNRLAELNAKEIKASTLPGFNIGYRLEREDGALFNGFGVSINLPTWNVRQKRLSAESFISSASSQSLAQKSLYKTRITGEYRNAFILRDRISELNKSGVDGSYLGLLKEALDGGELSILDFLREQAYFKEQSLSMIELQERYQLLLNSLHRYEF